MLVYELIGNAQLVYVLLEQSRDPDCWSKPMWAEQILAEAGITGLDSKTDKPETIFRRCNSYLETYIDKVRPYNSIRSKFRDFMELKRWNPTVNFGKSDKPFTSDAFYARAVPGLRHAHITFDLSILYKIVNNELWLYGFYTHDELGTGQPSNIRKQSSMASYFAHKTIADCPTGVKRQNPKYK